ncbi:MAG: TlyA family RNA methyltransferase [Chloroflexota bacterium]
MTKGRQTSEARRIRLDQLVLERGLAETRAKARALVMAGEISLPGYAGRPTPGQQVRRGQEVVVRQRPRYVSRAGEKLASALEKFAVDAVGKAALDVGASTGGFTDCLLQHGARRVYAVDVGRAQLHSRLLQDERVTSLEATNARYPYELPERVDLVVADVSFISLRMILPEALRHLRDEGQIIALFKPQFEAERREVPRGGVIKDPLLRAALLGRFVPWLASQRLRVRGLALSPVLGDAGNAEFLLHLEPEANVGRADERG